MWKDGRRLANVNRQKKMSIFTLPASVSVTNPANAGWSTLTKMNDSSYDTTTEEHYASGSILTSPKFKFVNTNGVVSFHVNNFSGSNASGGNPSLVSKIGLNGSDEGDSVTVSHGDTVYFYNIGATSLHGQFTIPSSGWWSVGPGTLGSSFDTASFAGTTVQQIHWSITNGSSPTPNSNYYLFSETPGGTAKDTINIGSNPQAGATSTDTYQNPSGADFTGRWYIGYGQNATRVNLATYNFSRGKVFCNFW